MANTCEGCGHWRPRSGSDAPLEATCGQHNVLTRFDVSCGDWAARAKPTQPQGITFNVRPPSPPSEAGTFLVSSSLGGTIRWHNGVGWVAAVAQGHDLAGSAIPFVQPPDTR